MRIIYGRAQRQRSIGFAARFCPFCRDVTAVKVYQLLSYWHLYFIPITPGKPAGFRTVCCECSAPLNADGAVADAAQPTRDSLKTLVSASAVVLGAQIQHRLRLERQLRQAPDSLADRDRANLLIEPFDAANESLVAADGARQLGAIGLIALLVGCIIVPLAMLSQIHKTGAGHSTALYYALAILGPALGLPLAAWSLWQYSKQPSSSLARRLIIRALAPLNPQPVELTAIIQALQDRHLRIGRLFTAKELIKALGREQRKAAAPTDSGGLDLALRRSGGAAAAATAQTAPNPARRSAPAHPNAAAKPVARPAANASTPKRAQGNGIPRAAAAPAQPARKPLRRKPPA